MTKIEFYNSPDGNICCKPFDQPMFILTEEHKELIADLISIIHDLYPGAFAALSELYSKSERNKDYYQYKIVHRFIRCNFGEYDPLNYDININGEFKFEHVKCPLRGECKLEEIICKPTLHNKLTARENEVAMLIAQGLSRQEIADELEISICTVSRHRDNIMRRLQLKHTNQIISKLKAQRE